MGGPAWEAIPLGAQVKGARVAELGRGLERQVPLPGAQHAAADFLCALGTCP